MPTGQSLVSSYSYTTLEPTQTSRCSLPVAPKRADIRYGSEPGCVRSQSPSPPIHVHYQLLLGSRLLLRGLLPSSCSQGSRGQLWFEAMQIHAHADGSAVQACVNTCTRELHGRSYLYQLRRVSKHLTKQHACACTQLRSGQACGCPNGAWHKPGPSSSKCSGRPG